MAHKMRAMLLERPGAPLRLIEREIPRPGPGQILIKVKACGVCRTDLHVVDGDLPDPKLPLIPGHEIVGEVDSMGEGVDWLREGQRVGIPWLGHTCGGCRFCRMERENLCDAPGFTGYTLNGGYAEYTVADARYCFPLPGNYDDLHAAPLLCAGLIGYRSYALAKGAEAVGLYGFGAAAHIIAQVAVQQKRRIYAFTRPGDVAVQDFARDLGAVWAGDSGQLPPEALDAAILFAPVGTLVPQALKAVRKGGQVICAGIHMSDIPSFPYSLLWGERSICSVANLTRRDGEEFLAIAAVSQIRTEVHPYPLTEANRALEDLRQGRFQGAAVLVP
ncbi:MAG: zinc-dependent alcohol dehydrogenase family protein [Methylohalobius sp. ZOD2]